MSHKPGLQHQIIMPPPSRPARPRRAETPTPERPTSTAAAINGIIRLAISAVSDLPGPRFHEGFVHGRRGHPSSSELGNERLRCCCSLQYKLVGKKSNRRPRTATKSMRKRYEGPWVWIAYREERYLFPTHIVAPYFVTFVRRVPLKPLKEASMPRVSW